MKKKILLILKLVISGILLTYLFSLIPFTGIISSFKSARIILVLAGIILAAPIQYLSAFETKYLTKIQGMSLSVFEILKIHLVTSFYGLFLPGMLSAGPVKWYKFSKYGSKSAAAAVVVFNRFLELMMTIFIGILSSLPILYSLDKKLFFVLLILFSLMILSYFILLKKWGLNFVEKPISVIPLPVFLRETVRKFFYSMSQFQNLKLKDHLEIIGILFLYHVFGVISFFFFAKALSIDLNIWSIGWIRSVMSVAIMLPLSFAGLGIREGTLVFLLGKYGIQPDISMALSLLFFFKNILTALFGGLIEFKDFIISKKTENLNSIEVTEE